MKSESVISVSGGANLTTLMFQLSMMVWYDKTQFLHHYENIIFSYIDEKSCPEYKFFIEN